MKLLSTACTYCMPSACQDRPVNRELNARSGTFLALGTCTRPQAHPQVQKMLPEQNGRSYLSVMVSRDWHIVGFSDPFETNQTERSRQPQPSSGTQWAAFQGVFSVV